MGVSRRSLGTWPGAGERALCGPKLRCSSHSFLGHRSWIITPVVPVLGCQWVPVLGCQLVPVLDQSLVTPLWEIRVGFQQLLPSP